MTLSTPYRHLLANDGGYILHYPNIGDPTHLLQDYPVNPYAESLTKQFPLGTEARRGEEQWFYCKNGAAALSTLGTPIQSAAAIHGEADDDIIVAAISAIGATTVSLTSTANLATSPLSVKDGFAEGYLIVNDAGGEGQLYKIKSHEAASGTAIFIVTLYDPLTVAVATTTSEVGLIQNPFALVIATAAPLSGIFIGVNQLAITASYYFWAKSKGPAPGNMQAACAKGSPVTVGGTAAKFNVLTTGVTTRIIVGEMLTPGVADTEKAIIYLYGR